MWGEAPFQIVGRADMNIVIVQLKEVNIPDRTSLSALYSSAASQLREITLCLAALGGQPSEAVRHRVAETEGFEPSIPLSGYAHLANECLQPLGHVSVTNVPSKFECFSENHAQILIAWSATGRKTGFRFC